MKNNSSQNDSAPILECSFDGMMRTNPLYDFLKVNKPPNPVFYPRPFSHHRANKLLFFSFSEICSVLLLLYRLDKTAFDATVDDN
jgi:hypothetical protein